MNSVKVICVRNVNDALNGLIGQLHYMRNDPDYCVEHNEDWRNIAPRGMPTLEHCGPVITEYRNPTERVLFNKHRDANPFFHFMEALWILDGRNDVKWITHYLKSIAQFSDDGAVFHAAYGSRMRRHFTRIWEEQPANMHDAPIQHVTIVDQLIEIITLLRKEPETRRAVMSFWDPAADLNINSKDIPCNDLLMFKLRDGRLDLTVCCRSNDAIWGAYGANAVQFSMLQEFVAGALNVSVGYLRQVSDSFHVYTSNEAVPRMIANIGDGSWSDPYSLGTVSPYPLFEYTAPCETWLEQLRDFTTDTWPGKKLLPFFADVANPIKRTWDIYKSGKAGAVDRAISHLVDYCGALDWKRACIEWLRRHETAKP